MNLPKGFHLHGNKIRFTYWNPAKKRADNKSTGFPPTKEGIRSAKKFKKEFLEKLKSPSKKLIRAKQYLTLSEAVENYVNNNQHLSGKTIQMCEYAVNHFTRIVGDKIVIEITKQDSLFFNDELKREKKSQNTRSTITKHLHSIFNYFVDEDYITSNPIKTIPQLKAKPKPIKESDLKMILDYLQQNNISGYNIIYFLYLTGLRIGEAIELRWRDVDFAKKQIEFQNFKGSRNGNKRIDTMPLFEDLRKHLNTLKRTSPEDRIFGYTNQSLSFYYRAQNILFGERRYSIHQLRKTFITKLVNSPLSADLNLVREFARHSKISTTLDYYTETKKERMRNEIDLKVDFTLKDEV